MHPATERAQVLGLGTLLVDSSYDGESVSTSTRSLLDELDGGLLNRVGEDSALLSRMGLRSQVLRRGSTTLAGIPAGELLEMGKDREKTVRSLIAEVLMKEPATTSRPLVAMSLKMGGQVGDVQVEPWVSEVDSLAPWDRIGKSFRLRKRTA